MNKDLSKTRRSRPHLSRRRFLQTTGLAVIATGTGGLLVACGEEATPVSIIPTNQAAIVPQPWTAGAVQPGPTGASQAVRPTAVPPPMPVKLGNPLDTANIYFKAWNERRYDDMYNLLSKNASNYITPQKFVSRYTNIADEATVQEVQSSVIAGFTPPAAGQTIADIPFKVIFKTIRVGDFSQDNKLHLIAEDNNWRVEWTPAAIFKELDNTTYLVRMIPANPARGEILTRDGQPLTKPAVFYSVYVVPGKIENEEQVLTTLSQLLNMDKQKVKDLYKNGQPDWRMPIKDLPTSTPPDLIAKLSEPKGVFVDQGTTRGYPQGQTAAQVVGYLSAVNEEDLKTLAAKGYSESDLIGRVGVEAWGESILAGGFGGKLTVVQSDGNPVVSLVEKAPTPSANLVLNLDLNIQKQAETLLAERVGSIVVLDPTNGAVLALASFPRYDPNLFVTGISADQLKAINDDPRRPFQNRAVNGVLPTGSCFKPITMAAALEKAGITAQTRYTCTGHWTGLGTQFVKDCWNKSGHGSISVVDGLTQSCDVVFYELGKKLDEIDSNILPSFAKSFGLGAPTGLVGLYDSAGQVPDPAWKREKLGQGWVRGDAVNLAIGQGDLLASPLQVALVYAAIANSGAQPLPRLADRAEGQTPLAQTFASQMKGHLAISEPTMTQIRAGLLNVTQSGAGTARSYFAGAKVRVAGKTGTAESGQEQPHAWFACYAPCRPA